MNDLNSLRRGLWPLLKTLCLPAGSSARPRATHAHPSETIRAMCRLPRNLIWNNGGHKFRVYLISEALSFPRGPIGGGWRSGSRGTERGARGRGTSFIPEKSSLSLPLLRCDSRGRGRQQWERGVALGGCRGAASFSLHQSVSVWDYR